MITASGLSRLRACPGSAVLPRAENFNEWAKLGNDEHDDLSDLENVPEWIAKLLPEDPRSEVKLAYDVATGIGRIIGEGAGRSYGTPSPTEIVGSADVLGVQGDAVVVLDYKTGYGEVEPASSNAQLWFYALAAARALGKSCAIVRILFTKTGRWDEYEIDPLELAQFAAQIEALHRRVTTLRAGYRDGDAVDTREGAWCKHCPSKARCPSKVGLLVQVAEGGLAIIGDSTMTPDRARSAYEQIERVEQLAKEARQRLNTYVEEQGPIDLGGGRFYGRYMRPGNERIAGPEAVKAIRAVVGSGAAAFEALAVEPQTSKAAIERAAKSLNPGRGVGTKIARAIIEKCRELGGVTSSPTYPIGEHRAEQRAELPPVDVEAVDRLLKEAK